MRAPLLFVVCMLLAAGALAKADDTVTFREACSGDDPTAGFMQSPALWQSTPGGSVITFDTCGPAAFSFVRLMISVRGTGQPVANLAIPVVPTSSSTTPGCITHSASTNLLVITGAPFLSELRAVADGDDLVNFLARRCVN